MKINKKLVVSINGFPQKIHIWGQDPTNSIILFVHGGPGNPFRHRIRKCLLPLTDRYIIAAYDQRGVGGSYRKMDPRDLRPSDYVKDIECWAEWLSRRFDQKQVYLVGESWGSFIGSLAVAERPELFKGYIGYGQIVDMKASLTIQYHLALEAALKRGDEDKEKTLIGLGEPSDGRFAKKNGLDIFFPLMYQLLEDPDQPSFLKREIYPFYLSAEYSIKDKINWSKGKALLDAARPSWGIDMPSLPEFLGPSPRFAIPYYVFQGRKDFITPWQQIPDYIEKIEAPKKEAVFFEHSGHVSAFDEPQRFMDELRKRFN